MDRRTLLWTGGLGAVAAGVGAGAAWLGRPAPVDGGGLASLSPALTETVFALGRGERLVARTPYCTLPSEALALPEAGTALAPDLEALATLEVGRVLVDGSGAAQTEVLERVAPVEVLPWLTLDEVLASVRRLAALVDADPEPLTARLRGGLTAEGPAGPRIAVLLAGPELEGGGPFWFIKAASLHGTAVEAAGFSHAIDPDWTGPPQIGVEGLIAADPEVVVVLSAAEPGSTDEEALLGALGALPLAASRAERLFLLEGAALLSVGPSILELVEALRGVRREVSR